MTQFSELVLLARSDSVRTSTDDLERLRQKGRQTDKDVTNSTQKINKGFNLAGSAATKMAAAATAAFGAIAAGVSMNKAIGLQLKFGSALAEASTLIDGNVSQMKKLEGASRDLAKTYGTSATQQAQAFYQAISAGAGDAAQATTLLDTANRLAIGGVTEVTTAVDILTTAVNVYRAEGLEAAAASDALFVAMRAGKTTIGELSTSLGKVLPLSQSVGVSFDETAAAVAALTKGGIATTEAVTGLRAILAAVNKPSKEAADLAAELGIQFNSAAVEAMGLAGFLEQVTQKTNGSNESMALLFGGVEAIVPAMSLAGQSGVYLAEIMEDMGKKAGATSRAFDLMAKDDAKRLSVAMSEINDVLIGLGAALLTAIVPAVEAAANVFVVLAQNADVLAIALGVLAVQQIPATIAGLVSLSAWLATSEGLFIAGAVAAKGMALALNLIPFVAVVAGLTALYRSYNESRSAAADFATALDTLTVAQNDLSSATTRYYNEVTQANLTAMKTSAEQAVQVTRAALEAAQRELEAASFTTNFFGTSLFETERMAEAKAAVAEISDQLARVEAQLSAAEHAQENFNASLEEGGQNSESITRSLEDAERAGISLARVFDAMDLSPIVSQAQSLAQSLWNALGGARAVMQQAAAARQAEQDAMRYSGRGGSAQYDDFRQQNGMYVPTDEAIAGAEAMSRALKNVGGSAGGASKSVSDLSDQIERLEFEADPVKKYNAEIENLDKLLDAGLNIDAYTAAVQELNNELANQYPVINDVADAWADFVVSGFQDFEGFVKSVLDSFKSMLAEMISTAARNRILVNVGVGGSGSIAGTAASAATGGGGGGIFGGIGDLLFGAKGFAGTGGTGFVGGLSNALSGGGLFSIGSNSALAGGGFGATLGAALPVAGAALAIGSALFGSKEKVGERVEVTLGTGGDPIVRNAEKFERTGLFGGSSTDYSAVPAELEASINQTWNSIQDQVRATAESINIATDGVKGLWEGYAFHVDTMNKSAEETSADMQAKLDQVRQDFARLILQDAGVYEAVVREGEKSFDALNRIATSLTNVNTRLEFFGRTLMDVSVQGAIAAGHLVEAFGGLDAMASAMDTYFANFYSQEEQLTMRTKELDRQFGALGTSMPETKAAFRQLVEAQDLTTEAGRNLYAGLLSLSGEFAQLANLSADLYGTARLANDAFTALIRTLAGTVLAAEDTLDAAREAALAEYRNVTQILDAQISTARSARDAISRIFDLLADGLASRSLASDEAVRFRRTAVRNELAGGIDDPQRLGEVIQQLGEPSEQLFGSMVDFQRDYFRTSGVIAAQKDIAQDQLSEAEKQLMALEEQKQALERLYGPLLGVENNTGDLDQAMGRLEDAMRSVEAATLRVESAVDRLASAMLQSLSGLSGASGVAGMGQDAFSRYSQDRTNAILSSAATGALTGLSSEINSIYQDVLGRNVDVQGLNFFGSRVQSGEVSTGRVRYDVMTSQEAQTGNTPGFGAIGAAALPVDPVDALYGSMLGRSPDAAGAEFWRSTGLKGEALINAFRDSALANGQTPAFASGGMHAGGVRLVGERGPELEVTGPSRIYSADQTRGMLGGDPQTQKDIREMKEYIRELVKVNIKQERRLREIELQGEVAS